MLLRLKLSLFASHLVMWSVMLIMVSTIEGWAFTIITLSTGWLVGGCLFMVWMLSFGLPHFERRILNEKLRRRMSMLIGETSSDFAKKFIKKILTDIDEEES